MIRRFRWTIVAPAAALSLAAGGCADAVDALTSHSRPVASVAGEDLRVGELATLLADSPLPDSALTAHWARQVAQLWADYVGLVRLYQNPDTTAALDYDVLLEGARYYSALAVQQYRDSVVLAGVEPTDDEVRDWFERTQPLTRLDVRRIRLGVPPGAADSVRDSLLREARRLRERVAAGADFIEVARTASDEPASARGQVLAYQGHPDFHPAADSVVFALRPGEISPVIATDEEMVFYRIERRRTPEYESVEDILRRELTAQRREQRMAAAADSLLGNSRRVVADGAEEVARSVATTPDMAAGRYPGSLRLVRYEGGELTVAELRLLFQVRPDLKTRFREADDEDVGVFLYQLAGDEVLVRAATESGIDHGEQARQQLREGIAGQLAAIARRMEITHQLVTDPRFDTARESRRYVRNVLDRSAPVAWPTEFRPVLDQRYPTRVSERSAEAVARQARELRDLDGEAGGPADAHAPTGVHEPADEGEPADEHGVPDEPAAVESTDGQPTTDGDE